MSTTATFPAHALARTNAERDHSDHAHGAAGFLARLKASFYRFLERLGDKPADLDPEWFKRPPMPF